MWRAGTGYPTEELRIQVRADVWCGQEVGGEKRRAGRALHAGPAPHSAMAWAPSRALHSTWLRRAPGLRELHFSFATGFLWVLPSRRLQNRRKELALSCLLVLPAPLGLRLLALAAASVNTQDPPRRAAAEVSVPAGQGPFSIL